MTLIEEAESLLLYQFNKSPKLIGLVRALVKPFQEALDTIENLHRGQYIDKAYGRRLDVLGDIVAQPRRGLGDEDYRAWIDVGTRLNIGSGTTENVLGILNILYRQKPKFILHEYQPGDVVFTLLSLPKAPLKAVLDIVRHAAPVSTSCHFVRADSKTNFRFDVSPFPESHLAEFFEENT